MVGDGFQAEGQMPGDVAIAVALGDQCKNLAFAVGKFGEELRQDERAGSGEEVDQALGNGRAEDGFATACGSSSDRTALAASASSNPSDFARSFSFAHRLFPSYARMFPRPGYSLRRNERGAAGLLR
jgi:hypothetical protein